MRFLAFISWTVASALFFFTIGCSQDAPVPPKPFVVPKKKEEKKTPLESKSFDGVLKGKVLYDGEPPKMEFITGISDHGDKEGCLKGGPAATHREVWVVNRASKAVANIVVWVEPPPGKFFVLEGKVKERAGEVVVIDQPHCAFVPHVVTLFPSYFDGAQQVKTGQVLEIRNSAPFKHTVQWDPTRDNDAYTGAEMEPNGGKVVKVLNPQRHPLPIGCGLHNWMRGFIWIFDHPYHAITNADGEFQIDNVPTGVELTFKAWHESRYEPFEQRPLTFTPGANPRVELMITK